MATEARPGDMLTLYSDRYIGPPLLYAHWGGRWHDVVKVLDVSSLPIVLVPSRQSWTLVLVDGVVGWVSVGSVSTLIMCDGGVSIEEAWK